MNLLRFFILEIIVLLFTTFNILAQRVSGTVVSEKYGPMVGVTTLIMGTSDGAVTDIAGKFSLYLNFPHRTVQFSTLGFESQNATFEKDTIIYISLKELPICLEDINIRTFVNRPRCSLTNVSIKRRGLFRKPDTIRTVFPDTASLQFKIDEKKACLRNEMQIKNINDSINLIPNRSGPEMQFRKYIIEKIEYSENNSFKGIEGNCYVQFVINQNSQITDIGTVNSTESSLDKKILYLIKSMPTNIQLELGKYGSPYNILLPQKFQIAVKFYRMDM